MRVSRNCTIYFRLKDRNDHIKPLQEMLAWSENCLDKGNEEETYDAAAKFTEMNDAKRPEGLTSALNLLWEAESERSESVQAVQAELQKLVQGR